MNSFSNSNSQESEDLNYNKRSSSQFVEQSLPDNPVVESRPKKRHFQKRISRFQKIYNEVKEMMHSRPWILHNRIPRRSLREYPLPNDFLILDLLKWMQADETVDEALYPFLVQELYKFGSVRLALLSRDAHELLIGSSGMKSSSWLHLREQNFAQFGQKLGMNDTAVLRDIIKMDIPLLRERLQDSLHMAYSVIRLYRLSKEEKNLVSIGLSAEIVTELCRNDYRTASMYPKWNSRFDFYGVIVEHLLQNFLRRKLGGSSIATVIEPNTNIENLGAGFHNFYDEIRDCVAELKADWQLVMFCQQSIGELQANPRAKTTHTTLRSWIKDIARRHNRPLDKYFSCSTMLYAQICDMISRHLGIMILQRKPIAIDITVSGLEELPSGTKHPTGPDTVMENFLYWKKRLEQQQRGDFSDKPASSGPAAGAVSPEEVADDSDFVIQQY